jgi:hypothetical protein
MVDTTPSIDLNVLYDQLLTEWQHYSDLMAITNHQATRYEVTHRFLFSYLQTMKHNNNSFVNELVDPTTLEELIKQHPGAVFEQLHSVAPLEHYCFAPDPRNEQVGSNGEEDVEMQPASAPQPSEDAPPLLDSSEFTSRGSAAITFGSGLPTTPNMSSFTPPPTFDSSLFNNPVPK